MKNKKCKHHFCGRWATIQDRSDFSIVETRDCCRCGKWKIRVKEGLLVVKCSKLF